ncbi:Alpha/Beta hydrolase protein [Ilyonectria robusta]|uniref:Alpha/Beta hydrolase protein n=1 Tax=Ilyonectria robusta TaxID=1079257 RepID=UPI001E8E82D1|nr:Alpha/Beta hydrolase protein [Ilyonectria robusta]KAH8663237.1 Alpha/Beta hydrolase protein [Ilyonectria robusta]
MKLFASLFFAITAATAFATPKPDLRHSLVDPPPQLAQVAKTRYVNVNGDKIAYRRFGVKSDVPVIFLANFRASMDIADPLLFNYIAESREVILFDNAGVGHSGGVVADSIAKQGDTAAAFLAAIGVKKVNVLGFSMGGGVAQHVGINYPNLVKKLVLAGSIVGNGTGTVEAKPEVFEMARQPDVPLEDALKLFFYPSETSSAAGTAWANRIFERQVKGENRTGSIQEPGTSSHLKAIFDFTRNSTYFEQVKTIQVPVLVTNGKTDVLAPTVNSFLLQQQLPYAYAHIYPDSGHGHLFQFPKAYVESLLQFWES